MDKFKVDFSGTSDNASYDDVVPGDYVVKVKTVEQKQGPKGPYLEWDMQIAAGKCKGLTLKYRTSLAPQALFALRDLLTAVGIKVPKAAVMVDPSKILGKHVIVTVGTRTHEGNTYTDIKKVKMYSKQEEAAVVAETSALPFDDDFFAGDDEEAIDLD